MRGTRLTLPLALVALLAACTAQAPGGDGPPADHVTPPELIGTWRSSQFKAGAGWLPSGRGVFAERITVAADGRTFTSTIRYDLFDRAGKPIPGGGEATGRGARIDF